MTQALALKSILEAAGHTVSAVLLGQNSRRRVPSFFLDRIGLPVTYIDSPDFALDGKQQSIDVGATILLNARRGGDFRQSLETIRAEIDRVRPDLIVNFFEPLVGVHALLHRPTPPIISVGHQYMYHHPVYPFPDGMWAQRIGAKQFTRLSSFGSARRLALSYYPAPERPRLAVVPPLLRAELFALPLDQEDPKPFYLIYLLNPGYAEQVKAWSDAHPGRQLHCFWDHPGHPTSWSHSPSLTFHPLSDVHFLQMMARCSGLVCTAGFESTCEAMYLGKTILAVPVKGHAEQYWNALDLAGFGGGVYAASFDIDRLEDARRRLVPPTRILRAWVDQAPERILGEIEAVLHRRVTAVG
jgi:uncharacterized protein (TIGR00661 family)